MKLTFSAQLLDFSGFIERFNSKPKSTAACAYVLSLSTQILTRTFKFFSSLACGKLIFRGLLTLNYCCIRCWRFPLHVEEVSTSNERWDFFQKEKSSHRLSNKYLEVKVPISFGGHKGYGLKHGAKIANWFCFRTVAIKGFIFLRTKFLWHRRYSRKLSWNWGIYPEIKLPRLADSNQYNAEMWKPFSLTKNLFATNLCRIGRSKLIRKCNGTSIEWCHRMLCIWKKFL